MHKKEGTFITYALKRFDIHGKLQNIVFRRKRNGEKHAYLYEYVPKYEPTVLSRRTDAIARIAATISNPRHADYSENIVKIYYYTPYFVYPGTYNFTCNTFYNIRKAGDYQIQIGNIIINRRLTPRTRESFTFEEEDIISINCWMDGKLWSERMIVVITEDYNLEGLYRDWLSEHLGDILASPEPGHRSLKKYHREIIGVSHMKTVTGKAEENLVIYKGAGEYTMHARKAVDHAENPQTRKFLSTYQRMLSCWKATAPEFNTVWKDYHKIWFRNNVRRYQRATNCLHLWTLAIHRAAAKLSFDLENLSVDNWLPGVQTLGDLLKAAGLAYYGLTEEKLGVEIFLM
ncbi:MAG: hypothetical protein K9N06_10540 [Candidatus Cloacimonetes bacterium]|nr:hypothetical protein [Candidatus Cloacimonadota bacterium]